MQKEINLPNQIKSEKKLVSKYRLYIEFNESLDEIEVYDKKQIHKITNVLRLKNNDLIQIFNNESEYVCKINLIEKNKISLIKIQKIKTDWAEKPKITLAVCLIKSEPMKWLIQKAVELGADEIIPVISQRVVAIEKKPELFEKKFNRFNQIIIQASEQSGKKNIPKLHQLTLFENLMQQAKSYENKIILSTQSKNFNFQKFMAKNCLVLIGPEGDFSDEEYLWAASLGFEDLTLGNQILRAETATISVLSILNYLNS